MPRCVDGFSRRSRFEISEFYIMARWIATYKTDYSYYVKKVFPAFRREHPILSRRFAGTIDQTYDACSYMTDEDFQDAITDEFLGIAPEADIFWFVHRIPWWYPVFCFVGWFNGYIVPVQRFELCNCFLTQRCPSQPAKEKRPVDWQSVLGKRKPPQIALWWFSLLQIE